MEIIININKDELYSLIKEAVKEVLHEEAIDFFLKGIPSVKKEIAHSETRELGSIPAERRNEKKNLWLFML